MNTKQGLYFAKKSRNLGRTASVIALCTVGYLNYEWSYNTFPNKYETHSRKIDTSPSNDKVKIYGLQRIKEKKDYIIPDYLNPYQVPGLYTQNGEVKLNNFQLDKEKIKYHMNKMGLSDIQVEESINRLKKQGKPIEITTIFNDILKNEGDSINIETNKGYYTITGQETNVNIWNYEKPLEDDNNTIRSKLNATFEPKNMYNESKKYRKSSYLITGLSFIGGITVYKTCAHRIFGPLFKGPIRGMGSKIGLLCLISSCISYPFHTRLQRKWDTNMNFQPIDKTCEYNFYISTINIPKKNQHKNEKADIVLPFAGNAIKSYVCGYIGGIILGLFMLL